MASYIKQSLEWINSLFKHLIGQKPKSLTEENNLTNEKIIQIQKLCCPTMSTSEIFQIILKFAENDSFLEKEVLKEVLKIVSVDSQVSKSDYHSEQNATTEPISTILINENVDLNETDGLNEDDGVNEEESVNEDKGVNETDHQLIEQHPKNFKDAETQAIDDSDFKSSNKKCENDNCELIVKESQKFVSETFYCRKRPLENCNANKEKAKRLKKTQEFFINTTCKAFADDVLNTDWNISMLGAKGKEDGFPIQAVAWQENIFSTAEVLAILFDKQFEKTALQMNSIRYIGSNKWKVWWISTTEWVDNDLKKLIKKYHLKMKQEKSKTSQPYSDKSTNQKRKIKKRN